MPISPKEPRLRVERAQSLIQELLGTILPEYLGEQNAIVTVSAVEVSGDLRHAKVWLSILGGNDAHVLQSLQRNIYEIQGDLNRQISMKIIPRIQFSLDTSPRYAQHIAEVIDEIKDNEDEQ